MYTTIDDNSEEQQIKFNNALQNANKIKYEPVAFDSEFDAYADTIIKEQEPEKYQEWKNKGGINIMEAGKMYADEFDGTYDNVLTNDMQRDINYLSSKRYRDVEDKIQKNKQEKEERNKRVNEGTASFWERVDSAIDRWANNSVNAQIEHQEQINRQQKPNAADPNKKYLLKGFDRAGRPLYNEVDLKKQIGFVEGLHYGTEDGKALPLVAGAIEGNKTKDLRNIKEKISKGEQITEQELERFNRHREREYEKQVRGYTTGGIIGEQWLPSMFAFGSEIALGGVALKAIGLGGVGAKAGNAVANTVTKLNGSEKLAKGAGFVAEQLTQGGLSGAVTTTVNPSRLFATYQERRLNDEMKITDKGTAIFTEAKETPAKAFIKSLGEVYLSYFSEGMGGLIGGGIKAVTSVGKKAIVNEGTKGIVNAGAKQFQEVLTHCPQLEQFIKKSAPLFSKAYEKLNNLPVKGKSAEWLKSKVKFDGFLEELGEEVLEDVLNLTIGTNYEERSLENYRKAIFKTPEEWAVLAGVMALQGGSLSVAGNLLGGIMQKNGNSPEEITDVLSNSTESEKGELIEGLIQDESIKVHDITTEEKLRKEEIKEDIYNKLINANVNKQIAEDISITTGKFFENFGVKNEETRKKFDTFINNLKIKYNVPIEALNGVKFQEISTAGANETEAEAAAKEWKEKGTESSYFKKWFGNSKVVDKKGKPLVVYHGTYKSMFEEFQPNAVHLGGGVRFPEAIYFTNKRKVAESYAVGNNIFDVYLKIENPYEVDAEKKSYNDFADELYSIMTNIDTEQYDGIIVRNMRDSWSQKEGNINGDTYIVFNPEQIKSVDNRGTFDANNPNIYFQKDNVKTITPIHIDSNAVPNFESISDLKEWIENNLSLLGDIEIKDTNRTVKFSRSNIGRSMKGIKRSPAKRNSYAGLKELVENSIKRPDDKEVDDKHIKRNNGQEIYHNAFEYDGDIYGIEIAVDIPKSEKSPYTYAGHKIKIIKNTPAVNGTKLPDATGANISINYIRNIFNTKNKIYFQSAYHGAPRKFDRFSTEHIGSGEGAQAHGWGLYFAANKEISHGYMERLSEGEWRYKGKRLAGGEIFFYKSIKEDKQGTINLIQNRIDETQAKLKNKQKELKETKSPIFSDFYKDEIKSLKTEIEYQKNNLKKIKSIDVSKIEFKTEGQLFEVDVPENDVLIDEQKDYKEQPEKVKNALIELVESEVNAPNYLKYNLPKNENINMDGRQIYNMLSRSLGGDKNASETLNKYGIKGIVYNGLQDGKCYVVFDDEAINVLKTYYQENEDDIINDYMIAGYNIKEVSDKLAELYEKVNEADVEGNRELSDKYMAKVHILEDAIEAVTEDRKFQNADMKTEIALNAYYVMNDEEVPEDYITADKVSIRSFNDYKEIHNRKKEEKEREYLGYFRKEAELKPVITIMANSNASTALHEFGHLYLDLLNELAKVDDDIKKKLDAVNKWLGTDGEYTTAQHEKFARSFEAYLYKGKAPNSTLKGVFEHFKAWLKDVYESITDLADKGADISPEVQELFDSMFSDDEHYEEKKKTNELLKKVRAISKKEKVSNNIKREDNSLNETEKRHKEAAYDILSIATGKSANYLKTIFETNRNSKGFDKKRENIQSLIEKVGDKITVSGGMKDEWKEFYTDTGVSYENDEIGSDYELAQKAFDDIVNKNWRMSEDEINNFLDERAISYGRAIDEADRQYKILLREFKKGNKNVALSAIYEWLEGLGGELQKDYEERFIYDSAIIEREENVDKFEKAKREILKKAMELENQHKINNNEKYQETVKQIIKSLDFLVPSDKARLTANVLDVSSTSMLMSSLDNILDIARTMEDVRLRLNLEKEIHKELQGTKNVKKNGRTVGKYNYKTNKIFEKLRELDRLTPERANEIRLENKNFAEKEDKGLSYKDKLINKFLSYKAGGRTFADTELMKELYDEIVKIKLIGKTAKSELELQEKLTEEKDVDELIDIVQSKKDAKIPVKKYVEFLGNLESTVNTIFNKEIKERYATEILYAETEAQAWQHKVKQEFEQEVAKIYNLPQYMWDKKILDYLAERHTYSERRRQYDAEGQITKERSIDRTLTKMDIIQAYIWSKNEVLEKRLINQFGEDVLDMMFDELSIEDVKLAELMMRTAQSFYPLVNKAFIQKYGLDLPKVSCYFPSTPERGSEVDLYNEYSSKSLNNGFTKSRAQSEILPMDFHNPVATLYSHIEGVSKFAFMSDSLDKANLRFKNLDLKRAIINKYGEDVYRTLEQNLINVTYKKEATVFSGLNKVLDNVIGNWIQANIAIKPIVGLKQLLSANNYAVDMPYMTWQKGFLKAIASPKETIDYMMKIPYIKARYEGNFSNEYLKSQIENSAFAATKKFKDALTMFVKIGDIGAIIFGGKPYVDYLINEKGMSEDEAIKKFVISTNRSQQSSAISSLSNFQVNMTRNPMGKLFIAFKNSPQQYIRMCGDAIISCANGDITKKQCAKLLFQFGYLQPLLYAIATSGSLFRFLFTGDDDDLLKDLSRSIFNLGSDAIPFINEIRGTLVDRFIYKEKYIPQSTPLLGDIQNELIKISKEDVTLKDYLEAVGYLGLHVGFGFNTKAAASMTSGAIDIFKGDAAQGSMKILGYTDRRAKHITK